MKQNSILISVIIPVYNVEKYLNECIDSVINSTYKDLEIILVDDGSSDNCPQICDKYACMDNRIKVIHKENEGLSSARNEGFNIANGDYISFIDSDDYISTNLYEIAVDIINEQNCDIFSFGYYLKYGNKNKFKLKPNTFLVLKPYEAIEKLNLFDYMGVSSWNKIFKNHYLVILGFQLEPCLRITLQFINYLIMQIVLFMIRFHYIIIGKEKIVLLQKHHL